MGQLAAALLGRRGLRVLAVDAAPGPSAEPRAAALDDESLRALQAAGASFGRLDAPPVELRGIDGRARPVPGPRARPFGHPPLALVHQPALEAGLLAAVAACPDVTVAWETRFEGLALEDDAVRLRVREPAPGAVREHRASWLLACDGARSPVRGALGIPFAGSTFAQPWLVLDARVPWAIGPEPRTQFVGDPVRPAVNLPLGPGRHRWEFMLGPGEDHERMREPAALARLLAPWIALDAVEVERVAVYTFHARRAIRWRAVRVLLLGDAAHVMPPFAGQGLAAGMRDAANATWKVADVLAGTAGEGLLDTYEAERRPSVEAYTELAVRWGAALQTRRPRAARVRDGLLGTVPRLPGLGPWLEEGGPRPRPALRGGAFDGGGRRSRARAGGRLFPQPEVLVGGRAVRLDDAIGPRWAVLGVGEDPAARMGAAARRYWRERGAFVAVVLPASADAATGADVAPGGGAGADAARGASAGIAAGAGAGDATTVLVELDGVVARWAARSGAVQIVLRPDRYVFAVAGARNADAPARAHERVVGAGVLGGRRRTGAGAAAARAASS